MTEESLINDYLVSLRTSLQGLTLADREDIVQEIRMHIRERMQEGGAGAGATLAGLGPAAQLAEQYRTGLLVQQARHSISPWVILRAGFRWAVTGVEGTVVFLIALFGYSIGGSFLLLALLKPLFPAKTGLWVGAGVFDFSFRMGLRPEYPSANVHEVLGWWLIPVCLVAASLTMAGTTKLIQFLMKRFRRTLPLATMAQTHAIALVG